MTAPLPNWLYDLVADLQHQEDIHPKLYFTSGAFEGYRTYDWCPATALAMVPADVQERARVIAEYKRRAAAEPAPDPDLWGLVGGPKPGFCCQDAYAAGKTARVRLHTSGCRSRCGQFVAVPNARERDLPKGYPCALDGGHDGDCWLHPDYRLPGGNATPSQETES